MFGLEKNAWIAGSAVLFFMVVALGCDDESRAATFVGVPDVVVDTQFIGVADANLPKDEGSSPTIDVRFPLEEVADFDSRVGPKPGAFGWPCTTGSQCASDYCVETAEGQICTDPCIETCPDGFVCKTVTTSGSDVINVCVSNSARLCWPCTTDTDCASPNGDAGAKCLSYGDAGAFCGIPCAQDANCPSGYVCGGTDDTLQCVPADNAPCDCNALAIELKLETACANSNEAGTCSGVRRCGDEGLEACDATAPATELCDGLDNDCDGVTDGDNSLDCVQYYPDTDGDGYGIGVGECLCSDPGPGWGKNGGDCNDLSTAVNPAAPEVCNFADDDCNGATDDNSALGCTSYYPDVDLDGYGGELEAECLCQPPTSDYLTEGGDCDDLLEDVNPDATEICDGSDNNCDGFIDEANAVGCTVYYVDKDGDGYGQNSKFKCLCAPEAPYLVLKGGDCNDTKPEIHPLRPEICNNIDDNCDGVADEDGTLGCGVFFKDADEDGFGDSLDTKCFCSPQFPYTALQGGDCNDGSNDAVPGGVEICDGLDNDCDGQTDAGGGLIGCTEYWVDSDNDGYGQGLPACLCLPDEAYDALQGGDCNDDDNSSYPGAQETCAAGDENCNGQVNEAGALGCTVFHRDEDQDGFGVAQNQCLCTPTFPYVAAEDGDCYDESNLAFPGQTAWFTVQRGDGSFDYDCDGASTRKDLNLGKCGGWPGCSTTKGWTGGSAPNCGVQRNWIYDCDSEIFGCDSDTESRIQACH
jgi:hypothetical protein